MMKIATIFAVMKFEKPSEGSSSEVIFTVKFSFVAF